MPASAALLRPLLSALIFLLSAATLAVVWANLGSAATPELMLFFAAVQVPIYVLPAALRSVYRRLGAAAPYRVS